MPQPRRLDLEENPEFLADLLNPALNRDAICEKWSASAGFVSGRRRKARAEATVTSAINADQERVAAEYVDDIHDPLKGSSYTRMADTAWGDAEWREFLRQKGTDPDSVTYTFGLTSAPNGGYWNKLLNVKPKAGVEGAEYLSLTNLYAEARKAPTLVRPEPRERATVIAIADWQIGKTGRRGGTPELLERLELMRQELVVELEQRRPSRVFILDGGDGMEGFESGGNPMFTNDLSFPDQIDCYGTELYKTLEIAHRYAPIEVGAVPSNHTAWRRAKQHLGRPSDDYGLLVHRQVRKEAEKAGLDAAWHFPDEYDESLCVDVLGTPVGLVHGNQFGPGNAIQWWEKQAFGSQAITRADVMLTAHYHTYGAGVAGINPHTGRERQWIGLPTLDNGSDHYRLTAGRDSLPGTLIFDVTDNGFDLQSLTIV